MAKTTTVSADLPGFGVDSPLPPAGHYRVESKISGAWVVIDERLDSGSAHRLKAIWDRKKRQREYRFIAL